MSDRDNEEQKGSCSPFFLSSFLPLPSNSLGRSLNEVFFGFFGGAKQGALLMRGSWEGRAVAPNSADAPASPGTSS